MQDVSSQLLVSPLGDPALTLRRQLLVTNLFKHVEEIRNLDNGYGFQFRRSHDQDDHEELIGAIADYIIFESLHAPQLTFEILEEPHHKAFWLQIGGLKASAPNVRSTSMLGDSLVPSLA